MSAVSSTPIPRHAVFGGHDPNRVMPWTDAQTIFEHCTGCGACGSACPENIISTGRGGHPYLSFSAACTFCERCADACSENVFDLGRIPAIAASAHASDSCLELKGISCRACEDACPQQALRVRMQVGGLTRIETIPDLCNGCGACIPVCPADAMEMIAHG